MSITTYQNKNGETLYWVYVNVRSQANLTLRAQRKISGVNSRREAEREETRLIRECEREIQTEEQQGSSWGAVVEAWEAALQQDSHARVNAITRLDYGAALRNHTQGWWARGAAGISRADVRECLNQLQATGASISYQNKMKNMISRVFLFGVDRGLIRGATSSPSHGIRLGREEQKKPEILTSDQIRKLMVEAKANNQPWYPIWAMALLTGMRSGELYALTWSDIDWEGRALSVTKSYNCRFKCIKGTKSGDWRTVPLSNEAITLLTELRKEMGSQSHVLPRLVTWRRGGQATELRMFCLGIGLPSIRFHTLRACFATSLIRSGIPPIQIQKICGWKDLETMQRYIRLAGIEITGATDGLRVLA